MKQKFERHIITISKSAYSVKIRKKQKQLLIFKQEGATKCIKICYELE